MWQHKEIKRKKNALKIVESGLAESLLEFGKQSVSDTDFKCRKLSCEVLQPNRKKKDFWCPRIKIVFISLWLHMVTSVLQRFLTIFHYHVLVESMHGILYAQPGLNQLIAANIANMLKGNKFQEQRTNCKNTEREKILMRVD